MKLTKNGYYTSSHAYFLLQYHLVIVTKYRHPVIIGELKEFLKRYTSDFFTKQGINIQEMAFQPDHMHVLFDAPANINLATLMNSYKAASSRNIRTAFKDELAEYYWKPYFWSSSYFLCTVSEKSTEIVKRYIENQKE